MPLQVRRPSDVARAVAFVLAAGLLTYYALRGGSYDIVPRQEEGILVWAAVAFGYGFGLLPRARRPGGRYVALAAVALLVGWTALGLSWTQSDERTLAEVARVLEFAGLILLVWGAIDRSTWASAGGGLAFAGVLVCALAVASRLDPSAFPRNATGNALGTDRLTYPFNYWNAVGAWGAMSTAMALGWSGHARRMALRALAGAALPVCALATYLSYSRAGAIGTALAVVLVVALARNRWLTVVNALVAAGASAIAIVAARHETQIAHATGSAGAGKVLLVLLAACAIAALGPAATWLLRGDRWRLSPALGRACLAAGVVVIAIVAATAARPHISKAWSEFRSQSAAPITATSDPAARLGTLNGNRYYLWRSAIKEFKHEPLHGTGPGTFEFWWDRTGGGEFVRNAHSLYLESLGEMGVIGLALVLAFLLSLVGLALRARSRLERRNEWAAHVALVSAFVVFLFHAGVDWMWQSTAVAVLAIVGCAVAAGPLFGRARDLPSERVERPRLAIALRVAVVVGAVVAVLLEVPGLVSTSRIRDSQRAAARGSFQTALADANDAVDAQPWAASPYVQRGLLEESAGRLSAARTDLVRAARREPTNWRHPLVLARIEAEQGNVRAALASFRKAKALRPQSPFFQLPQ